jgi:hypothetical protein
LTSRSYQSVAISVTNGLEYLDPKFDATRVPINPTYKPYHRQDAL